MPAADIRRIALEFAAAAPQATTMCNRGSSAHLNGFYNDRAIHLLNALGGQRRQERRLVLVAVGWAGSIVKTPAMPPSAQNLERTRRPSRVSVGQCVAANAGGRDHLPVLAARSRQTLDAYMTYNLDSPLTWPEESLTKDVMCNEELIKFHVCINPFYNETAHYADIVLPWTTYMERWDLDARASYNLRPYVGLRTPMVEPLGEARDVRWIFPELAKRIGGGMEEWYKESHEEYMRSWASERSRKSRDRKIGTGSVAGRRSLGEHFDRTVLRASFAGTRRLPIWPELKPIRKPESSPKTASASAS